MSEQDIIERLRFASMTHNPLHEAAAAEIERLRALLEDPWVKVEDGLPEVPKDYIRAEEIFLVFNGKETMPAYLFSGKPGSERNHWNLGENVRHLRCWVSVSGAYDAAYNMIEGVTKWMKLPLPLEAK